MKNNSISNPLKDISLSNSAIIAGIALILMTIIGPVANFLFLQNFIIPDDAAKTVSNILDSEILFRVGIISFLIVAVLDIIVAWALYIFLKPVNKSLSLLTALFRLVYASILGFILVFLINVLQLISDAEYLTSFGTNQIQALIMLSLKNFILGWELGLIIFGFHLFLLGCLIYKAGYMRKILGILLIIAASGYIIDGFGKIISSEYNIALSMYTFIGELILMFWLLIAGRKIKTQDQIKD